jgi:hypothetical protein
MKWAGKSLFTTQARAMDEVGWKITVHDTSRAMDVVCWKITIHDTSPGAMDEVCWKSLFTIQVRGRWMGCAGNHYSRWIHLSMVKKRYQPQMDPFGIKQVT